MDINFTLVVEMIIFAVFVFITMKFVWPPLMKNLEARRAKVAEGLAAADKGEKALVEAKAEIEKLTADAREQSAKIIRHAEERSQQIVASAQEEAFKEAARIVAKAQSDMEQELRAAKEALAKELGVLAVTAAGRIVRAEIDQKKHSELLALVGKDWN